MDGQFQGCPVPPSSAPVAIIGAGASGLLSAISLLRSGHPAVVLIERDPSWSGGPAYATRDPQHLLNVPAAKLSVDSARPADFVEWASRRAPGITGDSFLPRAWFGAYLQDSLEVADRNARDAKLTRVTAQVISLDLHTTTVVLNDGRSIAAADVVLALGNPPPRPLAGDGTHVVADPWPHCFADRVAADDSVVLVGSGLTALDIALTLTSRGHRGPVRLISRHGLLPRAHRSRPGIPLDIDAHRYAPTARSAVAWIRAAIANADGDWRAVFDAIRHETNKMWIRLPEEERARLLRHGGPYWEVHRHRVAPEIALRAEELFASGQRRAAGRRGDADRTPIASRQQCDRPYSVWRSAGGCRELDRQLHRTEFRAAAIGLAAPSPPARQRSGAARPTRSRLGCRR